MSFVLEQYIHAYNLSKLLMLLKEETFTLLKSPTMITKMHWVSSSTNINLKIQIGELLKSTLIKKSSIMKP